MHGRGSGSVIQITARNAIAVYPEPGSYGAGESSGAPPDPRRVEAFRGNRRQSSVSLRAQFLLGNQWRKPAEPQLRVS
jgi:hypothetical protein